MVFKRLAEGVLITLLLFQTVLLHRTLASGETAWCEAILKGSLSAYRNLTQAEWRETYARAERIYFDSSSDVKAIDAQNRQLLARAVGVLSVLGMISTEGSFLQFFKQKGAVDFIFSVFGQPPKNFRNILSFAAAETGWLFPSTFVRSLYEVLKGENFRKAFLLEKADGYQRLFRQFDLRETEFRTAVFKDLETEGQVVQDRTYLLGGVFLKTLRTLLLHILLALLNIHPITVFSPQVDDLTYFSSVFKLLDIPLQESHISFIQGVPNSNSRDLKMFSSLGDQFRVREVRNKAEFAEALRQGSQDDVLIIEYHGRPGSLLLLDEWLDPQDPVFQGIQLSQNTHLIFHSCRFSDRLPHTPIEDELWIQFAKVLGAKKPVVASTAILSFPNNVVRHLPVRLEAPASRILFDFRAAGNALLFGVLNRNNVENLIDRGRYEFSNSPGMRIYYPATETVEFYPIDQL